MNQVYDETLVLFGFGIEEEKKKVIPQEIKNNKLPETSNPRYFEEIISFDKVKNRIFSTINYQYNVFRIY
ncbi:MAG: hypothetical protein KGD65_05905 [Candidatus Lokiarchaeota archaeon]|nr:hypothetical protein [Candidatus Lokiarchaeota archaeon]